MTRQEMELIKTVLDDYRIRLNLYGDNLDPTTQSAKRVADYAVGLVDYEIDLMCADEAERQTRAA